MVQKLILRNKCVVLGNAGVGKSALVQTWITSNYPKTYNMTTQPEISTKQVTIPEPSTSYPVLIEHFVHDIPGSDIFQEHVPRQVCTWCAIKNATSFIVCFDVTNLDSFRAAKKWVDLAKKALPESRFGKAATGILVGLKNDSSPSLRVVPSNLGEELAKTFQLPYFECSSLSNTDVDTPFFYLSQAMFEMFQEHKAAFDGVAVS